MNYISELIDFLNKLEENKIYYRLNKIRDSIMIEVAVPGQRWEIEMMKDGSIEIEKFISKGEILDEGEIDILLRDFSD
jgi:hypothetical protein